MASSKPSSSATTPTNGGQKIGGNGNTDLSPTSASSSSSNSGVGSPTGSSANNNKWQVVTRTDRRHKKNKKSSPSGSVGGSGSSAILNAAIAAAREAAGNGDDDIDDSPLSSTPLSSSFGGSTVLSSSSTSSSNNVVSMSSSHNSSLVASSSPPSSSSSPSTSTPLLSLSLSTVGTASSPSMTSTPLSSSGLLSSSISLSGNGNLSMSGSGPIGMTSSGIPLSVMTNAPSGTPTASAASTPTPTKGEKTAPPSKVIHVRNLPFENVTKEELVNELVAMANTIAPVVKVVVFNDSQALLQMETVSLARQLLDRYEGSNPALLRGKRIRLQYSLQQEVVSAGNHKNIYLNPAYQHHPPPPQSPHLQGSPNMNLGPPAIGHNGMTSQSPGALSIGPSSMSLHYPPSSIASGSARGMTNSLAIGGARSLGASGPLSAQQRRSPALPGAAEPSARKSPLVQPVPIGPGRRTTPGSSSPSPPPGTNYLPSPSTTPSPTASPSPHLHHQHHNPHQVGQFSQFGLPLSTTPPPSSYGNNGGNASHGGIGGSFGPFSPAGGSSSLHAPYSSSSVTSSPGASNRERSLDRDPSAGGRLLGDRDRMMERQQQLQHQMQQQGQGQSHHLLGHEQRHQLPIGTSIPGSPSSNPLDSSNPSSPSLSPSSSANPSPLLQPSASSSMYSSGPTLLHPSAIQPSATISIAAIRGDRGDGTSSHAGSRAMSSQSSRSASPAPSLSSQQPGGVSVGDRGDRGVGGSSVFDNGFFPPGGPGPQQGGGPLPVKPRGSATSSLLHSHPSSAHASGHSTPTSNVSSSGPLYAAFQSSLPHPAPIHRPPSMPQMHDPRAAAAAAAAAQLNHHDRHHPSAMDRQHMYAPSPFDGHSGSGHGGHMDRSHTPGAAAAAAVARSAETVADLKRQLDDAHRQIAGLEKEIASDRRSSWDAHEPRSAGGGRSRLDSDGSISSVSGGAKWDRVKWDMQMLVANASGDGENSQVTRLTDQSLKDLNDTLERARQVVSRELDRRRQCKICSNHEATVVFLPCKHMVVCEKCQGMVQQCPMQLCRQEIQDMFIPSLV